MAQSGAIRRLKKEYASLYKEPAPGTSVRPLETNFLHAHFILHGEVFYDTPYEGGIFHGVLKFPANYPIKPPTVIMRTPSGRFEPSKKICFSMSDFHPELWNPMWSIRSILTGLISFMNSDEITTGGVRSTSDHRINLARQSFKQCLENDALASELFKDELERIGKEREASDLNTWPPKRPIPTKKALPNVSEGAPTRRRRIRNTTRLGGTRRTVESSTPTCVDENDADADGDKEKTEETETMTVNKAAKNKKKREREKRRKLIKKFTSNLLEQTPNFLRAIEAWLLEKDLDVSQYQADHICWRTETMEEYSNLVSALRSTEDYTLLIESEIGGRSIATFQMKDGISFENRTVDVVEIPAPKNKSPYKNGLEHVEYVVASGKEYSPKNDDTHQSTLQALMRKHPDIEWITKAQDKDINPDVSTKIELPDFGSCGVKFHLNSLADVIKYEISQEQ